MSYQRTEYRKEEDRSDQDGGWRSWFGLGSNKDRDDDRGYSYSRTTTYRDQEPRGQYTGSYENRPSQYSSSQQYGDRDRSIGVSGGISGGYGGERGGYGYQTTGERYGQGQQYGQQYGSSTYDRDLSGRDGNYYRSETRTYGGDRDISRYGGDSQRYGQDSMTSRQQYGVSDRSPSRGYGFSGDYSSSRNISGSDYPRGGDVSYRQSTMTSSDRDRQYQSGGDRSYGFSGDLNVGGGRQGGYTSSYRY